MGRSWFPFPKFRTLEKVTQSIMIPLESENTYHIFNRANGKEKLFLDQDNYEFFLIRYADFIVPIADTLCFCLMPNHFHLLLRIKSLVALQTFTKSNGDNDKMGKFVSKQFSNLFSSYTQAFNKQQGRMGSLFMKNFKRKHVTDSKYLQKLVHYIHRNPVEAGLCSKPGDWKFSSYLSILKEEKSFIQNKEILEYYGGKENFEYCHNQLEEL